MLTNPCFYVFGDANTILPWLYNDIITLPQHHWFTPMVYFE